MLRATRASAAASGLALRRADGGGNSRGAAVASLSRHSVRRGIDGSALCPSPAAGCSRGAEAVPLGLLPGVIAGRTAVLGRRPRAEQRHRVGGRRAGLDRVDVEQLVLVAERAGLVVDRHWADDRVPVALGAIAAGEDVV